MRKDNGFLSFLIFPLEFWRDFACPLHSECSLSLLVNQFRGSWIPLQVGSLRGHSDISLDLKGGFLVSGWSPYSLRFHLSPTSRIPTSPFPILVCDGALIRVVLALGWVYLMTNIGYILYGSLISCSYNWNISNPYVKSLHFHAIKPLVFMYLTSNWMSCIPDLYEGIPLMFDSFGEEIFMLYMVSIFNFLIWTIKSTFHMSKSS